MCRRILGHTEDENSSIGERNEGRTVNLARDLGLTVRPESNVKVPGPGLRGFGNAQREKEPDDEYRGMIESSAIHEASRREWLRDDRARMDARNQ